MENMTNSILQQFNVIRKKTLIYLILYLIILYHIMALIKRS